MVDYQLRGRGIRDQRVLEAMLKVPRHIFVDEALRPQAYGDYPLQIGEYQTISQPFMVALMTEALGLAGGEKVLEIGTGSGYQAAILAELAGEVFTVERHRKLFVKARQTLESLGHHRVQIRLGDGTTGWPEEAPFDAILVTAGSPEAPRPLLEQLKPGGRLIIPVGSRETQDLKRYIRTDQGFPAETLGGCRFVPLIGDHGWGT